MSRFAFDRLNEITPDNPADQPPADRVDAVGSRHGFTSREPMERIYKNEGSKQVYRILQAASLLILGRLGRANEASRHLGRATHVNADIRMRTYAAVCMLD